jgi:hypothetical protein
MQHSPSWEASRSSASQEIPRVLWNPKVHYRTHNSPLSVQALYYANIKGHGGYKLQAVYSFALDASSVVNFILQQLYSCGRTPLVRLGLFQSHCKCDGNNRNPHTPRGIWTAIQRLVHLSSERTQPQGTTFWDETLCHDWWEQALMLYTVRSS